MSICGSPLRFLIVSLTLLTLISTTSAQYGGGTGEADDPYLIYTAEQMNSIGLHEEHWDSHFKLMADLDLAGLSGEAFRLIGTAASPSRGRGGATGRPFTGVFDGNGHVISNFTWASDDRNSVGLFGAVNDPNAEIKDLALMAPNVVVESGSGIGSLVGTLWRGRVVNCHVEGGVVSGGDETGGLVGSNSAATITNCSVKGSRVSGTDAIGGLVGVDDGSAITDCSVEGGSVSGRDGIGGFVGRASSDTIANCYASAMAAGNDRTGGFVGYAYRDSTISNCYSAGAVSGNDWTGGLVGYAYRNSTITNCYSTGAVGGNSKTGGLVGSCSTCTIMYCYSVGTVDGVSDVGGLVGSSLDQRDVSRSFWDIEASGQESSAGGEGKTTAQMKTGAIFLAWVASAGAETWTIDEGQDYPRLAWENAPGATIQLAHPTGTGTQDDPYLIYTAHELSSIGWLASEWDKHFKLMADIDLSMHTGTTFNIIRSFSGVFDGNGHVISNLTYALPNLDEAFSNVGDVGLFGSIVIFKNAEIKNLGLVDPNVNARNADCVGALVGKLGDGIVRNCYVDGGTVTGGQWRPVGGLVGHNEYGTVVECYATAAVFGSSPVGGLVGQNGMRGTVANCYARGDVSGSGFVGGLVGSDLGDLTMGAGITDCYATGRVTGSDSAGGLVGYGWAHGIRGCFWDVETSGQEAGNMGIGLTTAEMQRAGTFRGWTHCDEEATWTIDEGNDYPRLAWENRPGEPIAAIPLSEVLAGSGSGDDPYLVHTAEELYLVAWGMCDWDKHFKLMADIDLSAYQGNELDIIGAHVPFAGVFDGNGHTIANFSYRCTDAACAGLFGYVTGTASSPNAEIRNLGLIDPTVDAGRGNCVGALVGELGSATVTNCYVKGGRVSGDRRVGGLVGFVNGGAIVTSYSSAGVDAAEEVGGLAGGQAAIALGCFWDIQRSGQAGGAAGTGRTTAEMQTAATFLEAGWDFADEILNGTCDYWQIEPGDYPRLRYSAIAGPVMPEGLGTAQDPYRIRDARDLGTVWFEPGAHYRLEASLDLSEMVWRMALVPWFGGTFDGNGHVISDLRIQGVGCLGLFGKLDRGAEVSNLGLRVVDVNGTRNYVGGLVGYNYGTITASYSSGTVHGSSCVGSLAGYSEGSIARSRGGGTISGNIVGGLVGINAGNMTQCCTSGLVVSTGWGAGGLAGSNDHGDLLNCRSASAVSGNGILGGLVGGNSGSIAACYSTGTVSGGDTLGGLVGQNRNDGSPTSAFWDVETSGLLMSHGGAGLTTTEMQTAATFLEAGWDFVGEAENGTEEIWWIDEGRDYPRLWWEDGDEF